MAEMIVLAFPNEENHGMMGKKGTKRDDIMIENGYIGEPIRPPAEAGSIILQATTGCPHNSCTFCGAYLETPFAIRSPEEFDAHARWVASNEGTAGTRMFLADGDTMILPAEKILAFIASAQQVFPQARRFALYAGAKGILAKSPAELRQLKDAGVNTLYLGLESGSDDLLQARGKAVSARDMIDAVIKAQEAGLRVSVMVLLGLGGPECSEIHARATAQALNEMQPRLLSVLTLMLIPGTPLWVKARYGTFTPLTPVQALKELHLLVSNLELKRTVFTANHASTHLPLEGALPRDKGRLLAELQAALDGQKTLVPDFLRAL